MEKNNLTFLFMDQLFTNIILFDFPTYTHVCFSGSINSLGKNKNPKKLDYSLIAISTQARTRFKFIYSSK